LNGRRTDYVKEFGTKGNLAKTEHCITRKSLSGLSFFTPASTNFFSSSALLMISVLDGKSGKVGNG
jgi:hypothetical protein